MFTIDENNNNNNNNSSITIDGFFIPLYVCKFDFILYFGQFRDTER